MGRRTRTHQNEPGEPAAPKPPSAWQRFNAHTPRYRIAASIWVVSIFLIPASILLHSAAATGVAIIITWVAIHNLRRVDMRERRAAREAAGDEPGGPATSAGTTPR